MHKEDAKILVLIPTLGKRLDLLRQTLNSISAQTNVDLDILVICPLKNKSAVDLSKKFGATIIDDPGSISSAVNAGINYANEKHKYITWIGDDDLLAKNSLSLSYSSLEKNKLAVLAFGYCEYINDKGELIFTSKAGSFAPWLMTWGPDLVPTPGILFRKKSLVDAGLFDEKLFYAMDLDMLLRLRKLGPFLNTKATLASFRWHPDSTTVSNRKLSLNEAKMVKRRYLPTYLRPVSPLWEIPVGFATTLAAKRVNKMASK